MDQARRNDQAGNVRFADETEREARLKHKREMKESENAN